MRPMGPRLVRTEATEVLHSPTGQSRPGTDCPPPGGRAAPPEPHRGFGRGSRRRPLSAPARSSFLEDSARALLAHRWETSAGSQHLLRVGVKVGARSAGQWAEAWCLPEAET